jgi:sulfatase maturation enzyme AslB (radical SAM superfamily)
MSPVEFTESLYLKSIQSQIIDNIIPTDCQSCTNLEAQGYVSTRSLAINDWQYDPDTVPSSVEYLDLRYSNLCNFSCRTCEPAFSSSITKEIHINPSLQKYYNVTPIRQSINSYNGIKSMLPKVKRINFTGGEPLLIKENILVLEELINCNNTNCEILITTNASVINKSIINLISQFNSVHWTISLDGVENSAEYIRYGTTWHQVNQNIHTILATKQSVAFNTVLSTYSVLDLARLVRYFATLKDQYNNQPFEIWFALCESPEFLNPTKVLVDIARTSKELQESITMLNSIGSNPLKSIDALKALHRDINCVTMKIDDYIKFMNYTNDLDAVRHQSFKQTFGIDL